jgi:hypothetical protein
MAGHLAWEDYTIFMDNVSVTLTEPPASFSTKHGQCIDCRVFWLRGRSFLKDDFARIPDSNLRGIAETAFAVDI